MLTDCGCSPTAVTKRSCLSLTGPVSGSWSDCKDWWTDFAEGRVEDTWTFLSMCGKDAAEGAQAAAASFDRNLHRALPRTPVYQEEEEEQTKTKNNIEMRLIVIIVYFQNLITQHYMYVYYTYMYLLRL